MNIYYQISLFTSFLWLLPVIRQRKSEYMLYLFILALGNPFTLVFLYLHHTAINSFFMINLLQSNEVIFYIVAWWGAKSMKSFLFISLLSFFAIHNLEFINKNLFLILLVISIFFIGIFSPSVDIHLFILFQSIILVMLLRRAIVYAKYYNKINIFDFIMVFFTVAVIVSFILSLAGNKFILEYNSGAEIFRILIASYFTIFKYGSKYTFINLPDYSAGRT